MCSSSQLLSPTATSGTRPSRTQGMSWDLPPPLQIPQTLAEPLHASEPAIAPKEQQDITEGDHPQQNACLTPDDHLPPSSDPEEVGKLVWSSCPCIHFERIVLITIFILVIYTFTLSCFLRTLSHH